MHQTMYLTLRQLQIFDAVVRQRSFTRAADALHLTQPAVSMQMRHLEEQIGVPLFDHVGKQIQPTDAGRELHRHATLISAKMRDLTSAMEEYRGIRRGELDLTVASTANYFMPKLIAAFCACHAKVQVRLQVSNQTHILETLSASNQDLAIMGQPPQDAELVARGFLDNPLMVIASPTHPLAERRQIPLAQLGHQPFITREPGSGTRHAAERHFSRHGVEFHSVMEMSSNEAIKQAVEAGLGLGILSLHTLELELATRRLVTLDVESFPIVRQWFVVHRKGKRLSAVAQSFLAFLTEQARRLASPKHPRPAPLRHKLDRAANMNVTDENHTRMGVEKRLKSIE